MKVPQFSPWVGKEEMEEIADCINSNWITEGSKSREFMEKLLHLTGSRFGVYSEWDVSTLLGSEIFGYWKRR